MPTPRFAVVDGQVVNATRAHERTRASGERVYLGGLGGGFGEYVPGQPLTGAEYAYVAGKMNATVVAMRTAFQIAQTRVAATPNALLGTVAAIITGGLSMLGFPSAPAEVKGNVANGLTTLRRAYDQQVVGAMDRVYSGALAPDRWFEMNRVFVDGIKSILDALEESGTAASMSALFDDMANDTAAFLRKLMKEAGEAADAAKKTLNYLPLILGVVGVVAAYTFISQMTYPIRALAPERKRLNGYRAPRARALKSRNRRTS